MKVFVVVAVVVALFAVSYADEDKKAKIISFYKCIACSEDPAAREEMAKCKELKPEKCKKIAKECKAKLMPEATTPDACWDTMCKKDDIMDKLYDCVMNHESRKDLTDEEKTQLKEFVNCTKKVNHKFCEH